MSLLTLLYHRTRYSVAFETCMAESLRTLCSKHTVSDLCLKTNIVGYFVIFGRPFACLSVCLSVCPVYSVCNLGVLWPNGWMDQDETWHAGSPRPWPHCVRWGPSSPPLKGGRVPQFSAHICCGEMAVWIKIPLGSKVGLSPSDIVLDGDPAPLP